MSSPFQCLTSLIEESFPNVQPEPPWRSLRLFPLILSLTVWEKRLAPTWLHSQAVGESDNVTPEPPFFPDLTIPAPSTAPSRI